MVVLATLQLIATLSIGLPSASLAQDGGAAAQAPPARRARMPAETSDLLTHSDLVACRGDDGSNGHGPTHARIATWNIRGARSAPVEAIAAELRAMQADVVALQEVDILTRRSGFVDQPAALAAALGFHYVFAASIKWDEGDYGLAVLSRWPLTEVRRHRLTAPPPTEPRIVLEVTLCANGRPLHLFNHHADGREASRDIGFTELRGIVQADVGHGMLMLGDFNEPAGGPGVRSLVEAGVVDLGAEDNTNTADGGRIDYLLADRAMAPRTSKVRVWRTDKSDHHAVLVDVEW
jgi:endonuclease/exonuclease/phosphatase family metal-dependent hydrolase